MQIFNWNDGPVNADQYEDLNGKIVFVVESPWLNRKLLFTQMEPIQINTDHSSWSITTEELAAWLCGFYDQQTLAPKAYAPACQRTLAPPPADSGARQKYLQDHLCKLNFIKLYDESVSAKFCDRDQLTHYLQSPALQTHLRQSILGKHPDIVLYLGCAWAHNEIFYKHKWNTTYEHPSPTTYIKHSNEIVYIGFEPQPCSYRENYESLRTLVLRAQENLKQYYQRA